MGQNFSSEYHGKANMLTSHGRKNAYDNMDEFLVTVSEKGQREELRSQEETHRKIGKAISNHAQKN